MQRRQNGAERLRQQIDPAGAFEHPDRYQHGYEERNDFQDDVERFLRAVNEFVVNLQAARGRIDREETQQKRNGQDRQCIHHARKQILIRDIVRELDAENSRNESMDVNGNRERFWLVAKIDAEKRFKLFFELTGFRSNQLSRPRVTTTPFLIWFNYDLIGSP